MIQLIKLKLGNYLVPIPEGLSELLVHTWVKSSNVKTIKEYNRQVIKVDDQFVTVLKKKS